MNKNPEDNLEFMKAFRALLKKYLNKEVSSESLRLSMLAAEAITDKQLVIAVHPTIFICKKCRQLYGDRK